VTLIRDFDHHVSIKPKPMLQQPPHTPQQHLNARDGNVDRVFNGMSFSPTTNIDESNIAAPAIVAPATSTVFPSSNAPAVSSTRLSASGSITTDAAWEKIRHKQRRLLLLHHASRCAYKPGTCPVTPHCSTMKRLWEHIDVCKNQSCTVQHCLSSRYILSHYRRCKDNHCPACGPVRENIQKAAKQDRFKQIRNEKVTGRSRL
jgi:TAZ zinc finger